MRRLAACLMFDTRYSTQGWLAVQSIRQLSKYTKIFVVCLDENVYDEACRLVDTVGDVTPISLYKIETETPRLLEARRTRTWREYTQTVKVFIPRFIFERYSTKALFYCDSDTLFWYDPQVIDEVMGDHHFMVSPHEITPRPSQGSFNGGFFACRRGDHTLTFLRWWEERVLEWCQWRADKGRFCDQGYLNIIEDEPGRFPGVLVCPHPGINLAPWNMRKHQITEIHDMVFVDDEPLVCFHYQDVNKDDGTHRRHGGVLDHVYATYIQKYRSCREELINGLDRRRRW